jgi:hypothetical protein
MAVSRIIMRLGFRISFLFKRLNTRSFLAMAGMAGPLVLIITDIIAATSAEQYNMVRDSISSLALTPMGYVQTIGFLTIGLLVEVFTAGLLFSIRASRGFHLSIGCLVFIGFGMLLIGAFHTDPVGTPDTVEGTIHSTAASIVFWLFPAASLLMIPSFRRDFYWQNLYKYTLIAAILALVLVIIVAALEDSDSWFGLMERLLVVNMIVWVEVIAYRLFRQSINHINR